jgi:hypothetical protein
MDLARFKQILLAFADSENDFEIRKGGSLAIQIGNEVITADLTVREGSLLISEGGSVQRAEQWIIHRIAMLNVLADRIIETIPPTKAFVNPKAEMLDRLEFAPTDTATPTPNALECLRESLERRPGGTCSVLYLTADAGEGKTTLIHELANDQARRFRNHHTDWLLVPISLAGKPFLRFEDVLVASLMNQLRFQRLYFDAFVELVRMGVLIPALDGFEEVFVETPDGDAVSSLGTLIRQLNGDGTLLIAARKAYFEFRSLETQAQLLDSLPNLDVAFARLRLERWGRAEFVRYCLLNGLQEGEQLYSEVTSRVAFDHPLVTRAVLVRRLVEIAKAHSDFSFIAEIRPESDTFFIRFIDQILEREANEKWIDKVSEPPKPLLTVREHHQLLSYIAEEMWISKKAVLSGEMLDSLAEIFCESVPKSPVVTRQVRERLKQHALIVSVGNSRREFAFDHDNFRDFFLGEQLGWHLLARQFADIRKLMRIDLLRGWTLDTAVSVVSLEVSSFVPIMDCILEAAHAEGPSSYVRENAGGLVLRILERVTDHAVNVGDLVFPVDAFRGRSLQNVAFRRCYFRSTSLASATLRRCQFEDCELERIDLEGDPIIHNCTIGNGTVVRALGVPGTGERIDLYDPRQIRDMISGAGFTFDSPQPDLPFKPSLVDARLPIFEKAIHSFQRSTHVSAGTFRLRLSLNATQFFDEIFPDMKRSGILEEITHGPGAGDRYRLAVPMGVIAAALAQSQGSYDKCLEIIKSRTQR